jgi:hypothetical protein
VTRTVRIPLALLVAFAWLVAGAGLAHAQDVVTFPGGMTANVVRNGPTEATFPAALATGVKAPLSVSLVSVRRDEISSPALTAGVKAVWVPAVPAVKLTLDDPVPRPGTYVVTIRIAAGQASQFATFTLTRANADVTVPSAVTVTKDEPFLWGKGSSDMPKLTIRCGPDDGLTSVSAWQNEAVAGTIEATRLDKPQCTNAAVGMDYRLEGDFPLGTSTRTLSINSPQLSAPKTVTFTILDRRPTWLIPLLVVLGLIVGIGSRRLIEPMLLRLKSKAALREAVDRVKAAHDKAKDEAYRKDLQDALDTYSGVSALTTADKIDAQTKQLLADADQAQQQLTTRLATIRDAIATKAEEIDRPWELPEASAKARVDAAKALDQVRARLTDLDSGGAQAALTASDAAVDAFHAAVQGDVLELNAGLAPLSQTFGATATGDAGTLRALADRVVPAAASSATDRARLEALAGITQLEGTLVSATQAVLADAVAELRAKGQGQAADTLEAVGRTVPNPVSLPAAGHWAGTAVTALVDTLTGLPNATDKVKEQLSLGDIRAAVRAAINSTNLGGAAPAPPDRLPDPTSAAPGEAQTDVTVPLPVPGGFGSSPPSVGLLRAASWLMMLAQFVVLAPILILVGLALYEKDWVGSWTQMVAVLTWAAALDLTTAAVLGAAKPTPAT